MADFNRSSSREAEVGFLLDRYRVDVAALSECELSAVDTITFPGFTTVYGDADAGGKIRVVSADGLYLLNICALSEVETILWLGVAVKISRRGGA